MAEGRRSQRTNGSGRRRRVRRARIPRSVVILSALVLAAGLTELVLTARRVMQTRSENAARVEAERVAEEELAAEEAALEEEGEGLKAIRRVSFAAVGDNIINTAGDYSVDLLALADAWSGEEEDGLYDFSPLYRTLEPTISSYDIAFINQETTLGGNEEYKYQGYPSYNTPDEVASAVANAGFDIVNCATNHTYDMWVDAIAHSHQTWALQDILMIGSYRSAEDRQNIRVVDQNGIKVAFLAYCYGQDGYTQDDLPNDFYAAPFDRTKMRQEILAAQEIADAVVVYMHWGENLEHEVSEEQRDLANYLAGLGVTLVIGSHSHVVQPVEYVPRGIRTTTGVNTAADKGMLCVYGLGDFVSGYTLPDAVLSGMFTCDFVLDDSGEVRVERPIWHALIEHNDASIDTVYQLSQYTQDLAETNTLLAPLNEEEDPEARLWDYEEGDEVELPEKVDPLAWARQTTIDNVGTAIEVVV